MHTILLVIHIISMVLSMALMTGAISLGLLGKDFAVRTASIGMVATALGGITGAVLLFFTPVLSECIVLTAYLSSVTALYIFGFGSGLVEKARLVLHAKN